MFKKISAFLKNLFREDNPIETELESDNDEKIQQKSESQGCVTSENTPS